MQPLVPLPHRFPFFFIDRIDRIVPGQEGDFGAAWSAGNYYLSDRVPPSFFQALLLEMMAQAAGMILLARESDPLENKARGGYLLRLDQVTFPHRPFRKDRLTIAVKKTRSLGKMQRFSGRVTEGDTVLVQGELTIWEES